MRVSIDNLSVDEVAAVVELVRSFKGDAVLVESPAQSASPPTAEVVAQRKDLGHENCNHH